MTIIVGLITDEGIYVGFDSLVFDGWSTAILAEDKAIEHKDLIIGTAGHCRAHSLLKYSLIWPERKVTQSIHDYIYKDLHESIKTCLVSGNYAKILDNRISMDSYLLIAYQGHLFYLGNDFGIVERKAPYLSIGSGYLHAQASLYTSEKTDLTPEERIKLAIECSNEFVMSTNNDITIKFQEYKKGKK